MKGLLRSSALFFEVIAVMLCTTSAFAQAPKWKPITEEEIGHCLNQHYDCPADAEPHFWRLDNYDFKGDGNEEAIAVVSTCETGTAGPDVHSVFARDTSGELEELKIPEADKTAYDNMFGNRNSDLSVKDGLLVETFEDDPDRDTPPLVISYKWNGKEFTIVSVKKTGTFPTSYNCAKVVGEVERAICHVKELADLDVQLDSVYRSALRSSTAERAALRGEQRAWVAERDHDCAPYKGWVECLRSYYQQRIAQLKKRSPDVATPIAPHN